MLSSFHFHPDREKKNKNRKQCERKKYVFVCEYDIEQREWINVDRVCTIWRARECISGFDRFVYFLLCVDAAAVVVAVAIAAAVSQRPKLFHKFIRK